MGADKTLVDAAFKEAATKYSGDVINMKPMYDSNVSNMNKVLNTISGAMGLYSAKKEANRIGVRKQMSGFQKDADALVKGMYAQGEPLHDVFVNAFRDKITSLQDEFEAVNTYGKGDTSENSAARTRIMGQLERVNNQAQNFRSGTEIFLDNVKNVNPDRIKRGTSISAYQQALNFKDYDTLVAEGKIKVRYGENGIEIISRNYDTRTIRVPLSNPSEQFLEADSDNMMDQEESYGEDVVVTLASLNENFKPSNLKHFADIQKLMNNKTKIGVDQGTDAKMSFDSNGKMIEMDYNEKESNAAFTRLVNTEDNFNNVVDSTVELYELETSFRASLEKELSIPMSVVQNMYIDDNNNNINDIEEIYTFLDRDVDGLISEKDVAAGKGDSAFEQNLDSLIDALTNSTHPAFNLKESSKMLGAFLAKISKGRQDRAFNKSAGKRTPKGSGANQQDIMAGVNGRMYNPATNNDEWVGRKREGGALTEYGAYDYDANNKLLQANKSFSDMFGNTYEPAIVGRDGKVVQWKVKEAGSGQYIVDDKGKEKRYSTKIATKNTFGGNYKSSGNIG